MSKFGVIKIFFDGQCPLCHKEMSFLKRMDKKNLIELIDISKPDFSPAQTGKSKAELMARIHAIISDNKVIEGVEVFRQAYSRIGMGWILWITKLPGFKQITDLAYSIFARNRIRIGKVFTKCGSGICNRK